MSSIQFINELQRILSRPQSQSQKLFTVFDKKFLIYDGKFIKQNEITKQQQINRQLTEKSLQLQQKINKLTNNQLSRKQIMDNKLLQSIQMCERSKSIHSKKVNNSLYHVVESSHFSQNIRPTERKFKIMGENKQRGSCIFDDK